MPHLPPRCRHLHTDGRQCGSPAVRHEKLCYQHLAATARPAYTPTLPVPEDLHAVQRGLAELLHLVSRELIEDRQAKRLFLILAAAGANLARLDRQRRAARELDLRERRLALAQSLAHSKAHSEAQLPASFSGCHSRRESASSIPSKDAGCSTSQDAGCPTSEKIGCPTFGAVSPRLRWAGEAGAELPVTDPVDDPELGLIAPGPEPEPRPQPATGRPTAIDDGWDRSAAKPKPQPDQPSPARQRELDAEALEQIEFDRRERALSAERQQIREAAYQVMYQNLSPQGKLKEDERYAAEIAHFFNYTLEEIAQLPPTPVLADPQPQPNPSPKITPQPL